MKAFYLALTLICSTLCASGNIFPQTRIEPSPFPRSPLNGLSLPDSLTEEYHFWLGGHLYGSAQSASPYPASTFLAHIPEINRDSALFFVALGDHLRDPADSSLMLGLKSSLAALDIPAYSVIGNHDLLQAEQIVPGNPWVRAYARGEDLFILLNTEDVLGGKVSAANKIVLPQGKNWRNIFVFSHRLIYASCIPGWEALDNKSNESLSARFQKEDYCWLYQNIQSFAKDSKVFWVAGDIGTPGSFSLFYQQSPEQDITCVASGIGDMSQDALVRVVVSSNGVNFIPKGIGQQAFEKIEEFGIEFWKDLPEPKNASMISRIIQEQRFWAGMLGGLLIGILITWIFGRRGREG